MTTEQAMQLVTPGDLDWAKQLRRENSGTWQQRWINGVDHYLADPTAVALALETYLAG